MPWPLRWAGYAVWLGFCAAMSLWAFELGKDLAGVDRDVHAEVERLRLELAHADTERNRMQSILNTSGSAITAERAAQERLVAQVRALETENRSLREDLGFFETLMPGNGTEAVAIRGLHAEVLSGAQLKWQVLVIQPVKNAPHFRGKLEVSVSGTREGKPWVMPVAVGGQPLEFRQYRRVEGMADLPPGVVVRNVSARVLEGTASRAVQNISL